MSNVFPVAGHPSDNGRVESKSGAAVRKHMENQGNRAQRPKTLIQQALLGAIGHHWRHETKIRLHT